ncbi:TRAP transporter substrate-binding protein DctP [Allosediminivita pacifica]|uniref:TRAP-type C4-dicarboxylate transport system substrate-binding protein n=1 Tax=Allosediminivita pacifica TaxID=1267769 RepID=A0A2T6ANI3_9RHOB|nr:TRAP transporter substrate-binding protein DctP [Allosediminivita pacifica]PTX45382.1 TRAP-type C4-dicarboxylate transport system substrate-binding protein [Allosediminivita pacifica]GGB20846.1 ABC transporter substrate-binding protein [Allosediminivita pacifica]
MLDWKAVIGTLALTATTALPAGAQEFDLRWGHYLANGPFLDVEAEFAQRIEERTDGDVAISISYAGALGGPTELLRLVGRGAVDMTAIPPGYYPDQLLYWKTAQIPFVFDSGRQAIESFRAAVEEVPQFREELENLNAHFLFQQPLGEYYFTAAEGECSTMGDLEGKKVRTFGSDLPKILDTVGATPVTVNATDLYEALQRGTLDISFLNAGNIEAYNLYEVGAVNCGPIMAIAGHLILINKDVWESMPEEYRTIFEEEAERANAAYIDWMEDNAEGAIATMEENDSPVVEFDPAELAAWKEEAPDLLAAWQEEMDGRGEGEGAAATVAFFEEMTSATPTQ